MRNHKDNLNDNAEVDSMLLSFNAVTPESMIGNSIWRWSNSLRSSMYRRTHSISSNRSIAIDIGAGSGQWSETFKEMPGCSFLLREPDAEKCKLLSRRLNGKEIHKHSRSFISGIAQMKKHTRKYHMLNCKLQDIVDNKACAKNTYIVVKCFIACFSTHYTLDYIDRLSRLGIFFFWFLLLLC